MENFTRNQEKIIIEKVKAFRLQGLTYQQQIDTLNAENITNASGGKWTQGNLSGFVARRLRKIGRLRAVRADKKRTKTRTPRTTEKTTELTTDLTQSLFMRTIINSNALTAPQKVTMVRALLG